MHDCLRRYCTAGLDDRQSNTLETVAQPKEGIRSAVGDSDWCAWHVQGRWVHDLDRWKRVWVYARYQFQPDGICIGVESGWIKLAFYLNWEQILLPSFYIKFSLYIKRIYYCWLWENRLRSIASSQFRVEDTGKS